MRRVESLYAQLRSRPCPSLAKRVGDCMLYESLLAGCADRVARGELLGPSTVPAPDSATIIFVTMLRKKADRPSDEDAFLQYFDLLDELRLALLVAPSNGHDFA